MKENKQEKAMALGPLSKSNFALEVLCSPVHVANISVTTSFQTYLNVRSTA